MAREEFFDTRVTGRAEAWHAIRMAIEMMGEDLETAQTILDAAGVVLPTGQFLFPPLLLLFLTWLKLIRIWGS